MIKKNIFIILLLLAGLFFSLPFLKPGLPATDDAASMVLRSTAFHKTFMDGQLPVRWLGHLNENYGYPVINFLYPLPFYLAEPLIIIGLSPLWAIKILFIVSTLASGLGVYFWLSGQKTKFTGFMSALIYMALPYKLIDLYQRGSLGECIALAIVPFILAFIDRYILTKQSKHLLLSGFLLAALITAHNSLAFILAPVILIYFYLKLESGKTRYSTRTKLITIGQFVFLGLAVSAFFWLPAILELQFTRSAATKVADVTHYFPTPNNLIEQLDLVGLMIVIISAFLLKHRTGRFFVVLAIICLGLQLPISLPLWRSLGLEKLVQFPLRFLSIWLIAVTYLYFQLEKAIKWELVRKLLLFMVLLFLARSMILVLRIPNQPINQSFFDTNFDSSTTRKEFTPIGVKTDPTTYAKEPFTIESPTNGYQMVEQSWTTSQTNAQIQLETGIKLTFNTHYFPGWRIWVDDQEIKPEILSDGRMKIAVNPPLRPSKIVDIKLSWQETPLRSFADLISLITIILSGIALIYQLTGKKWQNTMAIMAVTILAVIIGYTVITHRQELLVKYDPVVMKQRYLDSQWVNPNSKHPIGDHGLYAYAGWEYAHGENPVLINPEMPPLGKYLIGFGLILTGLPGLIGLVFSVFLLTALFLLADRIFHSKSLAIIPVALFSLESIFHNSLTVTMLDNLQVGFLVLAFYCLQQTDRSRKWFIPASLALGGMLATKFYATGFLAIFSIWLYYLLTRNWKNMAIYLACLPFTLLVHLLAYTRYFILGNNFRDYLGVQKYIYNFYQQGKPFVVIGSYWMLVFFNRWQVWWGARWGEHYIIQSRDWQITWVVNGLAAIVSFISFGWAQFKSHFNFKSPYHLLTVWLICYSIFLTFTGGWPHYLLLFLPFSNILLVKLVHDHHRSAGRFLRKLSNFKLVKTKLNKYF
jgi:hypothetical protein